MNYLDELIYRYERGEIDDASVCDNIERITKKEELRKDISEYRKKEKMTAKKYGYVKLSKSPERVLIEWEEQEKIFHFLTWLRLILGNNDWDIFCQSAIYGKPKRQIAEERGVHINTIRSKLKTINKKIAQGLPFYYSQFGNLQEYLKEG